jgi:Big-like domain-containing protein
MLRANCLPAVRLCLLFLATVLLSAIVLAASADPSRAADGSLSATGLSVRVVHPVSRQPSRRRSSSAQRAECAAAARTEKARKACAIKKAKARAKKPSVSGGPLAPALSPALTSLGVQEPAQGLATGEASPADAPEPTAPEGSGSPPKFPGSSGSPPVETFPAETFPVETPPAETPPVETFPVETPPAEVPPAETSPAETPPETSPAETPLAGPPVEVPLVETSSVGKSSATTTLVSSANPSTVGQAVTYTATVSPAAATGAITFREGGVAIPGCAKLVVTSGAATTCTTTYSTAGWHSIIAVYGGNEAYATSTSPTLTQVIHGDPSTVTLSSSLNPSMVGQAVTFTATVSPATATGTVEFTNSGIAIAGCTARSVSSGSATCTTTFSTAGSPWIRAVYSGDSTHATSTSPYVTQVVNKNASTTTLVSSANPSIVGQAVTYTATVSPAAATGAITFREGGVAIPGCAKLVVTSGAATTCTTTYSTAGWHSIIAVYGGDNNYVTSTSSTLTQVIHGDPSTVTLSSSLNPSMVGQAVTFTATVSPATATGTVEFTNSGIAIAGCTARSVSSGSATCTTTFSTAGSPWIRAVYSGDSTHATSTSPYVTQVVNKNASTTTLVSSANPSIVGQAVTYTATVSPAAATGAITFREGGVAIPGCAKLVVTSGAATTCTTTYSTAGWHSIIAVYGGNETYATSTSPTLTQVIHGDPTTVTLSSSLNPSMVGQAVTYTATVNPAEATGTVAFQEAGTALTGCSAQTINSGHATCSVTRYASWGSYEITATYSGDSNDLSSTSSTSTQTVEPPPVGPAGVFRFFSPSSFWNEELPTDAPLDPSSAEVVGAFDAEITKEEEAKTGSVNILTTSWSVPIYTVPAGQPTVKVRVSTENVWATPALQSAWEAVPLPADAKPAAGTDKHLAVWQPSTDSLWEFWHLEQASGGWQAAWGGAIEKASSDSGAYGPEAWPGAGTGWGASASSLSIAGGLITLEDLEKGVINHALAIGIPAPRAGVYALPAQRTDGTSTSPLSLPEGAHLRLEPGLDLAALHLPRLTLMIAEAAQRYGIFVRDTTGQVTFYAQDPTPTGTNPYTGAHGYFEGDEPSGLLASFPWSHLQLLKMQLHSTS